MKYILLIIVILLTIYLVFTGCSFDYDNDYINEPPDIIGTSCSNEDNTAKYTYGDFTLCVKCLMSADGLAWFEIDCDEFEEE